jgi:hypothetical protein
MESDGRPEEQKEGGEWEDAPQDGDLDGGTWE